MLQQTGFFLYNMLYIIYNQKTLHNLQCDTLRTDWNISYMTCYICCDRHHTCHVGINKIPV